MTETERIGMSNEDQEPQPALEDIAGQEPQNRSRVDLARTYARAKMELAAEKLAPVGKFTWREIGAPMLGFGVEIGVTAAAINYFFHEALTEYQSAAIRFEQTTETVEELVSGGPEGMKEVRTFKDSLDEVRAKAAHNEEAAAALTRYTQSIIDITDAMDDVYARHETTGRQITRLKVQLKGFIKAGLDAGNEIKPEVWKEKVDTPVIKGYVAILKKAAEWGIPGTEDLKNKTVAELEQRLKDYDNELADLYQKSEDFYRARGKNELTIKAFVEYLEKTEDNLHAKKEDIDAAYTKLLDQLKETYDVEDELFEADATSSVLKALQGDLQKTVDDVGAKVDQYKDNVDETSAQAAEVGGFEPPQKVYMADSLGTTGIAVIVAAVGITLANGALQTYLGIPMRKVARAIGNVPVKLAQGMYNTIRGGNEE